MEIVDLNYQALSVDTSIFRKYQWLFDRGTLNALKQFSDNATEFIIPKVINDEMIKHFSKASDDRLREAKKGIKSLKQFYGFRDELFSDFNEQLDMEQYALVRLDDFFYETGAEIISCADIDSERLVKMYAEIDPPFEDKKDKKEEFPDAIALLTLEAWAEDNKKNVLVVSADAGWIAFGEGAKRITVTEDLAKAIEYFQPHETLNRLKVYFEENAINDYKIDEIVTSRLTGYIEEYEFYPEGYSDFIYEQDETYATLDELVLKRGDGNKLDATVIDIDDDAISVELKGEVTYTVNASFSLYVRDSIDKDYLPVGSSSSEFQQTEPIEIIVQFIGDVAGDLKGLDIEDVEFSEILDDIDVGCIEPDWKYDDRE